MTSSFPSITSTATTRVVNLERLRWARAIWILIVVVNTVYGAINLGIYTAGRLQPCVAEPCQAMQLSIQAAQEYAQSGVPFAAAALLRPILELVLVVAYTGVGILLFLRRSDDWMGLFSGMVLCLLGFQLTYSIETLPVLAPNTLPISIFLTLAMLVMAYTTLYLFPRGRFESRSVVYLLAVTLAYELTRGLAINLPQLGISSGVMLFGTVLLCGVGLTMQVRRYRSLSPAERQQVKWIIFAFTLLSGGLFLSAFQKAIVSSLDGTWYVVASLLALLIQHVFYLGLPLAFTFSMLRYRLWDADLVINRTMVYVSAVVVLIVLFFGVFFTFNAILVTVTGANSTIPLVISFIAVAALFTPVSHVVAHIIDHQIYGLRVDLFDIEKQPGQETYFVPIQEAKSGRYTGLRVASYELSALLGRGAMSEVYSAQDLTTAGTVAVKMLPPELATQPESLLRFQREADALRQLNHPSIVRMISSGMSDGQHYLAMEWIDGETLLTRMNQTPPLTVRESLVIIAEIASALDASHAAGIVHRDVKPSNILLRRTDQAVQAVLTDFGIVKLMNDKTLSSRESFVGTPYYVAPEQITTSTTIDHRADIYGLGLVAYQLLVGRHPFNMSRAAVVFAHLNQPPPDPRSINPDLPISTSEALLKALAKSPNNRFNSAGAFAAALAD